MKPFTRDTSSRAKKPSRLVPLRLHTAVVYGNTKNEQVGAEKSLTSALTLRACQPDAAALLADVEIEIALPRGVRRLNARRGF